MSARLTLAGVKGKEGLKTEYSATFGWEKVEQGRCARAVEEINDVLKPNGIFIARLDKRYYNKQLQKLIAEAAPHDPVAREALMKQFVLPRAALQGLSISARQHMAVLGDTEVDEKLGPFARFDDGGSLQTEGAGFGVFPQMINIAADARSHEGQPFMRLHRNGTPGGVSVNEYHTMLWGTGTWFHKLGCSGPMRESFTGIWHPGSRPPEEPPLFGGYSKLELECSKDTGWRIVYRGDIPHGVLLDAPMKCCCQVIGPEKWEPMWLDDENPFLEQGSGYGLEA